jgi:excinuclease ABC subunit A
MSKEKDLPIRELDHIQIRGAREHNLKNIDVDIPKRKLVVITGVSGSGKSSLAFDTIYAEGQRRFVESLSSYARQFIGQLERPKYETIKGLSPTIAIEQKAASKNPRSTVGTITEIYDYMRVFYARLGQQYCYKCQKLVGKGDPQQMVSQILDLAPNTKIMILAPVLENRKGEHKELIEKVKHDGFVRVRIDGIIHEIEAISSLSKNKKHNIEIVIDRLVVKEGKEFKNRLTDSVEQALKRGQGEIIVHVVDQEDIKMSESRSCCQVAYPELDPPLFSFNSPLGMCHLCHGLGNEMYMDERKMVPDPTKSIEEGGLLPWAYLFKRGFDTSSASSYEKLKAMENCWGLDITIPWGKIPQKIRNWILNGADKNTPLLYPKNRKTPLAFEGLKLELMRRYQETTSEMAQNWYGRFLSSRTCQSCQGARLKPEVLSVLVEKKSIFEIGQMTTQKSLEFFEDYLINMSDQKKLLCSELVHEIKSRLKFLVNVGLGYLTLNRNGPTLSGGEAQRIRLAGQIGSELTGVLYVLDEPSIGLHQRDNDKLLSTLKHLRDIGNSLLVVEHDEDTMLSSDWIIDMGKGAGHLGGEVVAQGTPEMILKNPDSLTGQFLRREKKIFSPQHQRKVNEEKTKNSLKKDWLTIKGARANNLKNVDVSIPLRVFTSVTGVSGAGKSSLINQILAPALGKHFSQGGALLDEIGEHDAILGLEQIDQFISIDQKPIGRTPRSNPATYTKVFDLIRDLFAQTPYAKTRGFEKGRFSFNVKGGRCENCQGDGHILVQMHFLADVLVPCEVCRGKRFNDATLEVRYNNHSISDVLDLSVAQALELFQNHARIKKILNTLMEVGLSYIKLGQSATTLSGGEAQRIKLSRELAKNNTGNTLYLLDEPTTGLHFEDVSHLLKVLHGLVDQGNSVIVIEHNLDVIKTSDWVIDLGPEGGEKGGEILGEGTPEHLSQNKKSFTGQYLKRIFEREKLK